MCVGGAFTTRGDLSSQPEVRAGVLRGGFLIPNWRALLSPRPLQTFAVGMAELAQRKWWGLADRLMAKYSNGCAGGIVRLPRALCSSNSARRLALRLRRCVRRDLGKSQGKGLLRLRRSHLRCVMRPLGRLCRYVCKGGEGDRTSLGYPDWCGCESKAKPNSPSCNCHILRH